MYKTINNAVFMLALSLLSLSFCNDNIDLLKILNMGLESLSNVHPSFAQSIPLTESLRSDFFKNMMGFEENQLINWHKGNDENYNKFFLNKNLIEQRNINGKPQFIIHSITGKEYQAGFFTNPTIITLREQAAKLEQVGNGTFNIVIGLDTKLNSSHRHTVDIGLLQANPDNIDAVFQVASNFSALEPTGISHYPEGGITGYIYDYTQGPFASISAAPGLFYRMYGIFYDPTKPPTDWRQTKEHQIELLGGTSKYPRLKEVFPVTNGYVNYLYNPESLNLLFTEKDYEEIRIGYHRDIQVLYGFTNGDKQYDIKDKQQVINQVFTAAIDFGSLNASSQNNPIVIKRAQALLDAAYEGTFLAAATNKKKKVFLTLIGGGVFGNDISWIANAMVKNKNFIKDYGLDVTLIVYDYSKVKHSNQAKSLNEFKKVIRELIEFTGGTVIINGEKKNLQAIEKL